MIFPGVTWNRYSNVYPLRGNRKSFPLFFPYGENLGSDTVVRINTENIYDLELEDLDFTVAFR